MEKEHWKRLKEKVEEYGNGNCEIIFENGLPVRIVKIEGKDRDIDLTKEG